MVAVGNVIQNYTNCITITRSYSAVHLETIPISYRMYYSYDTSYSQTITVLKDCYTDCFSVISAQFLGVLYSLALATNTLRTRPSLYDKFL